MFKSTGDSTNNIKVLEEGEYEVYVNECKFSQTKSGISCIFFDFVIRNDIEQKHKNFHKFKYFYRDKETNEWPSDKIGRYANALGIKAGQDFDLIDLIGLNCVMVIKNFQDNKTGETKDAIFYLKPSKEKNIIQSNQFNEIDEEDFDVDIPF